MLPVLLTITIPPSLGIVSTRLRPWIELGFQPGRCIIEDDKVTFEFELALQNSGSAPARAVLVEASLLNAGPYQEEEVSAFYGSPVGEGERIAVIPPLKTVLVNTRVIAPRANVQLIEIGGRQVFVPLIAFNALYSRFDAAVGHYRRYTTGSLARAIGIGGRRPSAAAKRFAADWVREYPAL